MSEFNAETFGKRLAAVRNALGIKQAEIGDKIECSNGAYSLYERGKREPSLSILHNLCSRYGVSADYLLGCFTPLSHVFAERLRVAVEASNHKSLDDFAKTFQLDEDSVKLILSGTCMPNMKVIKQLCMYLNCSSDYLFGISDTLSPASATSSLLRTSMPRDPLSDLDPDLRSNVEGYIARVREEQRERDVKSKEA